MKDDQGWLVLLYGLALLCCLIAALAPKPPPWPRWQPAALGLVALAFLLQAAGVL